MRPILLLLLPFLICFNVSAQSQSNVDAQTDIGQSTTNKYKRIIYIQVLGTGGYASLMYDQRFRKTNKGLGFAVGVGTTSRATIFSDDHDGRFTIPAQINYIRSDGRNGYFDLGFGATYYSASDYWVLPNASVGYRCHPAEGVFFKIGAAYPFLLQLGLGFTL